MISTRKSSLLTVLLGAFVATQGLGQEALLRFSPEVGRTYQYSYSVNLDKTTMGQKSNERIEALFLMHIRAGDKKSYQVRCQTIPGRNNLQTEVMDRVMDRIKTEGSQTRSFSLSERYVFDPEEGLSLFLPQEKIQMGATWEGQPRLSFGDLTTSKPPRLKLEYRLAQITKTPSGRVALIEAVPMEKSVTAPLELGQLGIRCDETGAIVQLRKDSEAETRLKPGDLIIAINGAACANAKSRTALAARFIEPLNGLGSNLTLTVRRGGASIEAEIPKIMAVLGLCQVDIVELRKRVEFDLDKGIVLSDRTTARFSVSYRFQEELGFVDDYQGGAVLNRIAKSKIPPRLYDYEWRLVLAGTDVSSDAN